MWFFSCFFCFSTCFSDLQRLGELQSELAGMADFTATYLQCQLLLIKVWLHLGFLGCSSEVPRPSQWCTFMFWCLCWKRCMTKAQAPWISDIPTSLSAVTLPMSTPVQVSAVVPRAYVGSRAFCQRRVFSDRNHNGGNYSVAFYVRRVAFLCQWPLECFLLNCCYKWRYYRRCFVDSFFGTDAKGIL